MLKNTFLLLLLVGTLYAAIGIGVSPGGVTVDNVLRGGYAQVALTVSASSDKTENLLVTVSTDGPAGDWLTPRESQFTVKSGTQHKVLIDVEPPSNAANGHYKGIVRFILQPATTALTEGEGITTGMGITVGAQATLLINVVGEQILQMSVMDVSGTDIEIGQPFVVKIKAKNTGNVNIKPAVLLEVLDSAGTVLYSEKKTDAANIMPTIVEEFEVPFMLGLSNGDYTARISVFTNEAEEEPLYTKELAFKIVNKGMLGLEGELEDLHTSDGYVNEPIKIEAIFKNTGTGGVMARFKGDVIKDGVVVTVLESDEQYVAPGQTASLITYFTPKAAGTHEINGRIVYSQLETKTVKKIINVVVRAVSAEEEESQAEEIVPPQEEEAAPPDVLTLVLLVIVISVVILYLLWKWKMGGGLEIEAPPVVKTVKKKKKR